MHNYRVADWMSTPPITVPPTTSLAEAQRIMQTRRVRRLPVVKDQQLIGIVTWGDLRRAQPSPATLLSVYEWQTLLDRISVAECMARNPQTIDANAPVLDAARMMLAHKIGGIPVLDGGRLVGMITESDMFRLMLAESIESPDTDAERVVVTCYHCGARLRGRAPATIGPDDQCWRCYYHLHRCGNCKHFDGMACILGRAEQHSGTPGRTCPEFSYRVDVNEKVSPLIR